MKEIRNAEDAKKLLLKYKQRLALCTDKLEQAVRGVDDARALLSTKAPSDATPEELARYEDFLKRAGKVYGYCDQYFEKARRPLKSAGAELERGLRARWQ